jgi:hypothetical protein
MRYVIALIVMIVPAQAGEEQLVGIWKGPHTFELRVRNVWIENERAGSWRSDGATLFLQIHLAPMYSYRPAPIACRFVLSGDRLTIGGCTYAGEYTRRQN